MAIDKKELADVLTKSFGTIPSDDPVHSHTNNSIVSERSFKVELESFRGVHECRSGTSAEQPPFVSSFGPLFSPHSQLGSIETRVTDIDWPF